MNDELSPIEVFLEKLTSQIRWTTSISIFLITVALTIFAFKESMSAITSILMLIVLIPLILNVYFGWKITHECFLIQRNILEARILPGDDNKKREIDHRNKESSEKIEKYAKIHFITFIIGFIAFLIFVFAYTVIERFCI